MHTLDWRSSGRSLVVSLLGGSILASTVVMSGAVSAPAVSAAPALFCAPVNPNFGIFAGEVEEERERLRPGFACQMAADSGDVLASSNQMAIPVAAQPNSATAEDVWLTAYRALAYDEVE